MLSDTFSDFADMLTEEIGASWRATPCHFRISGFRDAVLDLNGMEGLLDGGLLRTPYAELVMGGQKLNPEEFCHSRQVRAARADGVVDPDRVRSFLKNGATLVLPRLDHWHRPTRELAAAVGQRLGRRVDAFAFCTAPGMPGIRVHRDDADVIMLQTSGAKRWSIHAGPQGGMWGPGPAADAGDPLLEVELREDEALYVPRGFAHAGVGGDAFSVHVSLTVREVGTKELRQELGRRVRRVGAELPPRPLDDMDLHEVARRLLREAAREIAALSTEELISGAHELQARFEDGKPPNE
ncbi:cupin domain-containing protein [Streptomyces sp. NPDC006307]|uniref:JmjC domain-containing protein n=1 Tax=Streptomyces sp. NPDC006307 TaxID=3156748 RepID=UPI0033AD3117